MLGTLGYLGIGHDLFTRYDRAKALFKDPNVYGPFLILPAMYALQRVLVAMPRRGGLGGDRLWHPAGRPCSPASPAPPGGTL